MTPTSKMGVGETERASSSCPHSVLSDRFLTRFIPIPWRVTRTGEFKPHLTQSYTVDQNSQAWESSPGALTPGRPLSPFFYQTAKKGRERPQEYSFLNSCYYDWAHWGWRSGSTAMRTITKVFPHIDTPRVARGRERLCWPQLGAQGAHVPMVPFSGAGRSSSVNIPQWLSGALPSDGLQCGAPSSPH